MSNIYLGDDNIIKNTIPLIIVVTVMGLVFLLITVFSYIYSLNSIKSKTVGDGQHGTARFATKNEIRKTYKEIPFEVELWRNGKNLPTIQGTLVGQKTIGGKTTALIDDGDVHTLMIGAAGVGKTAYFLYPNLEFACASGMSFITSDTKGDLYRNYGEIAKKYYGYNVSVIDLRNPTRSDGFNLLYLVNKYMDFWKENEDEILQAKPQKSVLDIDNKKIYIYAVTLENLKDDMVYDYRLGFENNRSNWYKLKTAKENNNKFKALIFPDSQSNDYTEWKSLAMTAWQNNQDSDFFINMGDLVDNGYDLVQWNGWFDGVEPMVNNIPVAPVQGNHETYTTDWQVAMPNVYLEMFKLPTNGNDKYQNQYYSFDYGDVHFTVINTQDDEMAEFEPDLLNEQLKWLENDLATTDKKWKVVLMHRDILNYGRDAKPLGDEISFSRHGEIYMPIFDKYDVDAVLTAHLHTYRRRALIRDFAQNEQGTLYILTGVAGNVRYPSLWHKNPLDEYVPPQPETNNYLVLEADENSLTFNCYLPDNTQIDTVTLTK